MSGDRAVIPAAREGERRPITALFGDVVGSTGLGERAGPDEMTEALQRLFAICEEEVTRFEGSITQILGDGFLALFGAPVAHEDHAERAVRAAWGIQQRLRDEPIVVDCGAEGVPLSMRMGLHSGLVVAATLGGGAAAAYTALGDTVNLASRLESAADPGMIALSAETAGQLSPAIETEFVGSRPVRGRSAPAAVHLVRRVGRPARRRVATPEDGAGAAFIGRDAEIGALAAAVASAPGSAGTLVLVEGDAGIGKSRLVREARTRADGGARWLEGRTVSFGGTLSYWPFVEMLRDDSGITQDEGEEAAWAKLERRMDGLFGEAAIDVLPYLASMIGIAPRGRHADRVREIDGRSMGIQIRLASRRLVVRLADDGPLVLVFEDLHWADRSSIELIGHLLPLCREVPVTMIVTARPDGAGPLDELGGAWRSATGLEPVRLALPPLEAAASIALLEDLMGGARPSWRNRLLERAEGNPLFLGELVRALRGAGVLTRDAGDRWQAAERLEDSAIPETLHGVMLSRIDRLDDELRDLLRVASVVGRRFPQRVVEAVDDRPDPLDGRLSDLQGLQLIRERRREPELEYAFTHALVQEATYESILVRRRRELHGRVAASIEHLYPDRLEEFYGVLAHHYAQAEDWDRVQSYLLRAGDGARRIAADAEAVIVYRRALEAYSRASGDGTDALDRCRLERGLGEALLRLGRHDEAREHLVRSLAHLGVAHPRSRAGVAAALLAQSARQMTHRLVPSIALRRRAADARERELHRSYVTLAWVDFFEDPLAVALDLVAVLNAAERAGLEPESARGAGSVGFLLGHLPAHRVAEGYFRRAAAGVARHQEPAVRGDVALTRGMYLHNLGRWPEALEELSRGMTGYWEAGLVREWGAALTIRCWILLLQGRFQDSLDGLVELGRVAREAGDRELTAYELDSRGHALWRLGGPGAAAPLFEEAISLYAEIPSTLNRVSALADLAECRRLQGRREEALDLLAESAGFIRERGFTGFMTRMTWITLATVELEIAEETAGRERAAALAAARKAARSAVALGRTVHEARPPAYRVLGNYHWLSGSPQRARRAWARGAGEAARQGAAYEAALIDLDMGRRTGNEARTRRGRERLVSLGCQDPG